MTAASTVTSVLIAGSGFMGTSIAYLTATKTACDVFIYDSSKESLDNARLSIEKLAKNALAKGLLDQEKLDQLKQQLKPIASLTKLPSCDLVIEAISEELRAKQELFKVLDTHCPPSTIFASNTSSLPITALAAATKRADRFIGMHFFAPAHAMKLIEIIPGLDTADKTIQFAIEFAKVLGKEVISSKDMAGFITTRLGMVLINEAAFALLEGLSTPDQIDKGMTLGYNHPMGPLALADFVGLDICVHIMDTMHQWFGDPKYRPCPLIRQLVSAGHLGKKTGKGFYRYNGVN